VVAAAHQINKTINTKANSIDQLNRFCHEAQLPPPSVLTTGTDEEKLDEAKESVITEVRKITEPEHILKAAAAAEKIFGPPNP
jgi:hypothetical protein